MILPNRSGFPVFFQDHTLTVLIRTIVLYHVCRYFLTGNWHYRYVIILVTPEGKHLPVSLRTDLPFTPRSVIILQELPMLPKVILHTAMSLDGRITNFPADLELYYTLAARWNPDAILFGSETVLAAVRENPSLEVPPEHEEMFTPPKSAESDPRPLLVIADSRGRVHCWDSIKKWPYMRGILAICSSSTPQEYLSYLAEKQIGTIISGNDRIDMRSALEALNARFGVNVVRVDSGGTLNSVLLNSGLVDEVSVLIHPFLAGGKPDPTIFDPLKAGITALQIPLKLHHSEILEQGIIWARYISLNKP
jgi:2,5-diamino-6-(ribosylamino)-4(3H)-pyrimidinone 5'-phosphate reductase